MGRWAIAQQTTTLDWRKAWQEIATGTLGQDPPARIFELVEQLDCAYHKGDRLAFTELKAELESHPWFGVYARSLSGNPVATSGKSEGTTPAQENLTLWGA